MGFIQESGVEPYAVGQMVCAAKIAEHGGSWGVTNAGSYPRPMGVVRKQSSPRSRRSRVEGVKQ